METHNRKIAQRSYPIQAGRASVTGCMLPAYSTCWQHNSIKRVGSRNFWADLKTRERGFLSLTGRLTGLAPQTHCKLTVAQEISANKRKSCWICYPNFLQGSEGMVQGLQLL